jgi:ribose-phosphate pyrophosphokinase
MSEFEELRVFTGTAHPVLAKAICEYLGSPPGDAQVFKFANDNTFVQFQENVRQRDVFLVQPFSYPVNDSIMELLIMVDAAKRASAGRITAVIPYYAYGRTDKKDQPRVPITARLVADLLTTAGADRVLTMDLHAGQIQGFFNIPVDELTALPTLARHFREKELPDLVVVATDVGAARRARDMARLLGAPVAIVDKERSGNKDQVEALNLIGEVQDRTALIVDDELVTGGTMFAAADILVERGVREVYACCTHGVLSPGTTERLGDSSIKELIITDTLPITDGKMHSKIAVLSVAPLLGEAIHRIHGGLSVGAMFE